MQEVKVLVPEARVAEFYRWFSVWLEDDGSKQDARPVEKVEPEPTEGPTPSDILPSAIAWWKSLKKLERDIFSFWIEAAPNHVSADEIVTRLNLKNARVIPGSLSWTSRRAKAAGFPIGWAFDYDAEQTPMYGLRDMPELGMTAVEYAELLAAARDAAEQGQAR